MRALALVLGLVSAEALIVEEAQTATIHVPGDYSTVYQALDAASSGDIVEVAPGTYDQLDTRPAWFGDQVSAVGFLKDGVTLKSSGGAGVTTLRLDSNSARPVILFGGAGDFQVEGFTFTGSLADLIGIAIQSPDDQTGSLHLLDCVIGDYGMGNTLTHEVAIDAYSADVHVQNCTIQNIDSPNAVAVYGIGGDHLFEDSLFENCTGGGIEVAQLFGDVTLSVKRCTFEHNGIAEKGAVSGQVIISLLVEDSWFFQNSVAILYGCNFDSAGGTFNSTLTVRNCTFAGNSSMGSQNAICAFSNAGEIAGNTFYGGNSGTAALNFNSLGPGSHLLLERNVFSFSSGNAAVDAYAGEWPLEVTSICNVYWQNAGGHTAGFSLGATDLVSDPQFCNAPAQDFTVNAASPCLPWNNNGCGLIGAWSYGCGDVSVEASSWGKIKGLYR